MVPWLRPEHCPIRPTSKRQLQKSGNHWRKSENPVIWIGIEIDRFGLREKAAALLRRLNIPYVTELLSKAVLSEDDPLFAGVLDGKASSTAALDLAEGSDFILALGVWLTDINCLGWTPNFDKTAFASWDAIKFGSYFSPEVSLDHLIDGLLEQVAPREASDRPQEQSYEAPLLGEADKITYQGFYEFISTKIDANTILGSDASMNYFGSMLLKVHTPRGFIAQSSYSSIGYIAPAATGICLAKEAHQRVMVFSGDGGFQMSAQCLSTQTRFGLNPTIFVINNGVYGVEQWLADSTVFSTDEPFYKSCDLHQWNYSKLSEVFGCKGWRVETYGELEKAIKGAKDNSNSPSIIEVLVPRRSIPSNATWKKK